MRDVAIVAVVLLPNLLLAITSKSGNNAGFFIAYSWIVSSVLFVLLGLASFFLYVVIFGLISVAYDSKLRLRRFFRDAR